METNNLTPDENLKRRIYFDENTSTVEMFDTVEAPGIIFGDSIPDDEVAETGAGVIVLLFASIFILAVAAILFCIMYFK